MADARRGLVWRAAWLVAVVLVILLWRATAGKPGYVVQIEFGMYPEVFTGAEVLVDGEVVGTLEPLRRRTLNGFRVEEGPHEIVLRKEGLGAEPVTVELGGLGQPSPLRLMADLDTGAGRAPQASEVMVLR